MIHTEGRHFKLLIDALKLQSALALPAGQSEVSSWFFVSTTIRSFIAISQHIILSRLVIDGVLDNT